MKGAAIVLAYSQICTPGLYVIDGNSKIVDSRWDAYLYHEIEHARLAGHTCIVYVAPNDVSVASLLADPSMCQRVLTAIAKELEGPGNVTVLLTHADGHILRFAAFVAELQVQVNMVEHLKGTTMRPILDTPKRSHA